MPFGLANAPSIFQRTMNKILAEAKIKYALIYMDDVLIPAKSYSEGISRLREVLSLLQKGGLTLKLSKCHFFYDKIDFLGFEVSANGIRPGYQKTLAISEFPKPKNIHDIRRFIGLTSFFRRFIKNFAIIARPLTDLLKKNFSWNWTDQQENSFITLKSKLVERPILALYDQKLETELHTDASKIGIAGILLQKGADNLLRPVAYYSRKNTSEEQRMHSFEQETLAVISSLNRFRVYLLGIKFKIVTDCSALRTTFTKRDLIPRIARWWIQFQEFDCEIEYRPGNKMGHVDALSRGPVNDSNPDTDLQILDVLNFTTEDWIATIQNNDEEIKRIKEILESKNTKDTVDIYNNYQLKGLQTNCKVYRNIDGGIRWVVPRGVRWQILRMNHDDIGHFGFEKTLERVRSTYWFPKMRKFIKKYCNSCLECAYHKVPGVLSSVLSSVWRFIATAFISAGEPIIGGVRIHEWRSQLGSQFVPAIRSDDLRRTLDTALNQT
ncbi:unnamed protein product, partial [Brenthis ino]